MNAKKLTIAVSALVPLFIVTLPIALGVDMTNPFSSIKDLLYSVFGIILDIFKLTLLKNDISNYEALMRLIIWIMTFAIFYAVLSFIGQKNPVFRGRLPIVISLCLATITAIFMPQSVLIAIGITYSAIWSVILMGSVFVAMFWFCYTQIKGEGAGVHGLRLLILFFGWLLIFNFTQIIEQATYGASPVVPNSFINPVLNTIWSLLNSVFGVAIIYEIIKLLGSFGSLQNSQTAVRTPTPAVLPAVNNTLREGDGLDRHDQDDLNRIGIDDNRESTAADRSLNFGRLLHTLLLSIVSHLQMIKADILAGKIDRKTLVEKLNKIVKALDAGMNKLLAQTSAEEWAYKIVSNEMGIVDDLNKTIQAHNKLVMDLRADMNKMDDPHNHKAELLREVDELAIRVRTFSTNVEELKKKCQDKSQEIYRALAPAQRTLIGLRKISAEIEDMEKAKASDIIALIDGVINHLNGVLNTLKEGEDFLSVFYTMNRDEKNLIKSQLNQDARAIAAEHDVLRKKFEAISSSK